MADVNGGYTSFLFDFILKCKNNGSPGFAHFAEENANNNNRDVEWNGSLISCVGGTQSIDEMRK